jgi:hypothetical protein
MKVIIEEVDGAYYAEVALSHQEIKEIKQGDIIDGEAIFKRRKVYVGARLQGYWDDEEEVQRKSKD